MFDKDKSGEITLNEFGSLYRYIVDWQNCFKNFDGLVMNKNIIGSVS